MSEGHEWHHCRHKPVLLQALLDILNIDPNGVYVDATYGCGGHSAGRAGAAWPDRQSAGF